MNWKIEIVKRNRKTWKEFKTENQWKRTKKAAATHAWSAYLWDYDNKKIIDGIY